MFIKMREFSFLPGNMSLLRRRLCSFPQLFFSPFSTIRRQFFTLIELLVVIAIPEVVTAQPAY
jgi:hypothetical protein